MSAAPNLLEARVALRHRPVLDVIDLSVRFLVVHVVHYLAVAAFVLVPAGVASLVVAMQAGWGWGWAFAIALASLAEIPFTVLASRLVFEPDVALDQVLGQSLRAMPKTAVARLLELLAIAAGCSIFFLPAVWVAASHIFIVEVLVLERASIGASVGRCNKLVSGGFGDALVALLALNGLHLAATFLGDVALRTILNDVFQVTPPRPITEKDGGVLGLVAFWAFVPFVATARLFCYLNVRTRSEGWDVQTRFAALATRFGGAGGGS